MKGFSVNTLRQLARMIRRKSYEFLDVSQGRRLKPPARPILVSSIPKAGTNLLKNIVLAIPGTRFIADIPWVTQQETPEMRFAVLTGGFVQFEAGCVYSAHVPYTPGIAKWLQQHQIQHVFIYRDPRDFTVSLCHYVMRETEPRHLYYELFRGQGGHYERLMGAIRGIGDGQTSTRLSTTSMPNVKLFYEQYLGWLDDPNTFYLRYEDLVTEVPGQRNDAAELIIINMLEYLSVLSGANKHSVAKMILDEGMDSSKSHTYRLGKSGSWRDEYAPGHAEAFKDVAGDLLIRLGYGRDKDWLGQKDNVNNRREQVELDYHTEHHALGHCKGGENNENTTVPFDLAHYQACSASRIQFLEKLLPELVSGRGFKTICDVGCGAGHFSAALHDMGFQVRGFDVRAENIRLARSRYPEIPFYVESIENESCTRLGPTDIAICFGLLYHLENPFRAIRNLSMLTRHWLVVESQVAPGREAKLVMRQESMGVDQSQHYLAFVPTRAALIKMLYAAGFKSVWKPPYSPTHPDFAGGDKSLRVVLVASKMSEEMDLPKGTIRLMLPSLPTSICEVGESLCLSACYRSGSINVGLLQRLVMRFLKLFVTDNHSSVVN